MRIPWQEESWAALRLGDVYPLPLATETNWAADGWEVNLILVVEVQPSGYSAHPLWTYREPYGESRRPREWMPCTDGRWTHSLRSSGRY